MTRVFNLLPDRNDVVQKLRNCKKHAGVEPRTEPQLLLTNTSAYDIRLALDTNPVPSVNTCATTFAIINQGSLGCCTGCSSSGAILYKLLLYTVQAQQAPVTGQALARLFVYYNERSMQNYGITKDSGASIADAVLAISSYGVPPETAWPFSDQLSATPNYTTTPTDICYQQALQNVLYSAACYINITSTGTQLLSDIKTQLRANNPVLFGLSVYASFESAQNGLIPNPDTNVETLLGGHAICIVGYNDARSLPDNNSLTGGTVMGAFTVRNSWGTTWGDNGYCYLPYAYILSSASAFWAIVSIGSATAVAFVVTAQTITAPGQSVCITGNTPETGNLNPQYAFVMTPVPASGSGSNITTWTATLSVEAYVAIQIGFVITNVSTGAVVSSYPTSPAPLFSVTPSASNSTYSASWNTGSGSTPVGTNNNNNTTYTFNLNASTTFGQYIVVLGNSSALGNWTLSNALVMSTTASTYPNWIARTTSLQAGVTVSFKFVVVSSTQSSTATWIPNTPQNLSWTPTASQNTYTYA